MSRDDGEHVSKKFKSNHYDGGRGTEGETAPLTPAVANGRPVATVRPACNGRPVAMVKPVLRLPASDNVPNGSDGGPGRFGQT